MVKNLHSWLKELFWGATPMTLEISRYLRSANDLEAPNSKRTFLPMILFHVGAADDRGDRWVLHGCGVKIEGLGDEKH